LQWLQYGGGLTHKYSPFPDEVAGSNPLPVFQTLLIISHHSIIFNGCSFIWRAE